MTRIPMSGASRNAIVFSLSYGCGGRYRIDSARPLSIKPSVFANLKKSQLFGHITRVPLPHRYKSLLGCASRLIGSNP